MRIKIFYKSFYIVLLCVISSGYVHAEYDTSGLQKLFTDKRQRSQIDAARSGGYAVSGVRQQTGLVTVNGYMTRSNGKSVVWLNNKNTLDGLTVGDINVQQANIGKNKKVGMTLDGSHVHLKPGETWDKETDKIVDNR